MRYPKKFFQIEEIRSDFQIGRFTGNLNDLIELRKYNRKNGKPLNSSFPYYPEEKKLITEMHLGEKSMGEIIDYFQRPENSIRKVLFRPHEKNLQKIKKVSAADLFFRAILSGADPITGEVLENNSPWANTKVISDIEKFLEEKIYIEEGNNKKTKDQKKSWRLIDIKEWVKTDDDKVDIVIIQRGAFFDALEEDAELLEEEFRLESYRVSENSHLLAGFPVTALENYIKLFEERNFRYVVVEETGGKHPNGTMIRKITLPQEGREF